MQKWEKAAGYALAVYYLLSLAINLVSLAGINLQALFPPVFALHFLAFGGFALGLIKILESQGLETSGGERNRDPFRMYKWIYQNSSRAAFFLFILSMIYGLINFGLFTSVMEGGGPSIRDGQWVLQNHGTIIREITWEEYNYFQAQELRGFSGIWMVFASFGLSLYWPWKKTDLKTGE